MHVLIRQGLGPGPPPVAMAPRRTRIMPAAPLPPHAGETPPPLVRLNATGGATDPATTATANIQMSLGGERLRLEITVPAGPARPRDLLPVLQGLTDVVVGVAVRGVEGQGLAVSCCK